MLPEISIILDISRSKFSYPIGLQTNRRHARDVEIAPFNLPYSIYESLIVTAFEVTVMGLSEAYYLRLIDFFWLQ